MTDISRIATSIAKSIDILADIGKSFGGFSTSDGMGWDLKQAKTMLPALIGMLPFREDDRIELVKKHPCPGAWDNGKHFLIKGAEGTISTIGYYDDRGFFANVVFDNETWIDAKNVIRPVSLKHTFNIPFDYLRKITTDSKDGNS